MPGDTHRRLRRRPHGLGGDGETVENAGERFLAKWQGAFKLDPAALKDERMAAIIAKHVR